MRIYNRISEYEKRKELRNNMTKAEVILWSRLKGKQLNGLKFRRQYSVEPYIIDFYCVKRRLAIEVDGDSHFEEGAREYDEKRQKFIERFNIKFLRFTNSDIYENLDGVTEMISNEVKGREKGGSP